MDGRAVVVVATGWGVATYDLATGERLAVLAHPAQAMDVVGDVVLGADRHGGRGLVVGRLRPGARRSIPRRAGARDRVLR